MSTLIPTRDCDYIYAHSTSTRNTHFWFKEMVFKIEDDLVCGVLSMSPNGLLCNSLGNSAVDIVQKAFDEWLAEQEFFK